MALGTTATAQQQPLLQLQGQPYFGGAMTLHVTAPNAIGQPVLLGLGLDPLPLDAPAYSSKGPFYIGHLTSVIALGAIAANGRLDLPFTMPPLIPGAEGTPIAMQAFVSSQLSNPATLPLDTPYVQPADTLRLTAPMPQLGANFGDTSCVGDFNGDGAKDIAVGSWFEDWMGIDKSGRVYVFWGPGFTTSTPLQSDQPKAFGVFGASLTTADLDNDGFGDLIVGEEMGDPPPPGAFGRIHVYWGGSTFSDFPSLSIPGGTTYPESVTFGRDVVIADFDGDGWKDIAVSTLNAIIFGQADAGRVDVFWGPTFGESTIVTSPDNGASAYFGTALAMGDVDGDGQVDLIEGSGRDDIDGVKNAGSVHVFAGGGRSLPSIATLTSPLPKFFNARFGDAVAASDVDGDGMAELVVEERSERPMLFWDISGTSYTILDKPPSNLTLPASEVVYSEFLSIGDVNHDGLDDAFISDYIDGLLVGCPIASAGVLYVSLAPYYATYLTITDPVQECGAEFSWRPTIADIDGDSKLELLVPAPTDDEQGVQNAGHVVLFYNN